MRQIERRGFTLIELLVVVGMIALLATILLPMLNKVQSQARRTAMAADLMVISQALDAYKGDFGDYPRLDRNPPVNLPPILGAPLLCWALVAPGPALSSTAITNNGGNSLMTLTYPGDGADGPGFRIRGTVGPVKGPYLPPDRFLIGVQVGGVVYAPGNSPLGQGGKGTFNNAEDIFADRNNSPILYFPATKQASCTSPPNGFVVPKYVAGQNPAVFYYTDNQAYLDLAQPAHRSGMYDPGSPGGNPANLTRGANGWMVMSYRLGDLNYNGTIDPGEAPITAGPYLLWSAGPDGVFGSDDDVMCDGTQLQPTTGFLPNPIAPH